MAVAVDSASPSSAAKMSTYWIEPIVVNVRNMATMKPQSPMRFVTNAFLPADALASSVNQNEMRKYEHAPTPSQPRKVRSMLSPSTSISIEKANRLR